MKKDKKTISIIGLGANGIVALYTVVKMLLSTQNIRPDEWQIQLFEPNSSPGIAFGQATTANILNTDSKSMGVSEEYPEGFRDFLIRNDEVIQKRYPNSFKGSSNRYPLRLIFGEYLESEKENAIKLAESHGIQVTTISAEVVALKDKGETAIVQTSKNSYGSDLVFLTIGNPNPSRYHQFSKYEGYVECPSKMKELSDLLTTVPNELIILGSGLSGIDAALNAIAYFPTSKVTLVSRSGSLPFVKTTTGKYILKYLSESVIMELKENGIIRLDDFWVLLDKEIARATNGAYTRKDLFDIMITHENLWEIMAKVQSGPFSRLQAMLLTLSPLVDKVWYSLSETDKRKFRRFYLSTWMKVKHPFPLQTAIKLQDHIQKGLLELRGGLQSVDWDEGSQKFVVNLSHAPAIYTQHLIDGSGAPFDYGKSDSPIIKSLIDGNKAIPHPMGGVYLSFDSSQILTQNGLSRTLYASGAIAKGVRFYVNAYTINRKVTTVMVKGGLASKYPEFQTIERSFFQKLQQRAANWFF